MVNREPDDDLATALALVIGRVNRRMRGAARSLGHGHLSAIATLHKHGPLRLGDLAAREVVSAPSMTRTVTELERRGLVLRSPDPDDGRSVRVELTGSGAEHVLQARSDRARMLAELMLTLEDDDREALRRALPALERLAAVAG